MDIQIVCKSCGKQFAAREEFLGRKLPCPGCFEDVVVAKPAAPAPDTAAANPYASLREQPNPYAVIPPHMQSSPPPDAAGFATEALPDTDDAELKFADDPEAEKRATLLGKKLALRKESHAIATELPRSFRNPIETAAVGDGADAELLDRLQRIRGKHQERRKMYYAIGTLVILLCLALNVFVTLPIILGSPRDLTHQGDELLANGDLDGAIRKYRKAVFSAGQFFPAYYRLGLAYLAKRDFDKSRENLETALSTDDNRLASQARVALARLCRTLAKETGGRPLLEEAMGHVGEALKQDPVNDEARRLYSELRRELLVSESMEDAFAKIYLRESERLLKITEHAFDPETLRILESAGSDPKGKPITVYFLRAMTYENPTMQILPRADNSIIGSVDVEAYTWQTPPRPDQLQAQQDEARENFEKVDAGRILSVEYRWENGNWVLRDDPTQESEEKTTIPDENGADGGSTGGE